MECPLIGIANSVSANFNYDPIDAIAFARQHQFEVLQIYLTEDLLNNQTVLDAIIACEDDFRQVIIHADGMLNRTFVESDYREALQRFVRQLKNPNYLLHFDENVKIDEVVAYARALKNDISEIYLENYFLADGSDAAERNIKKFLATFTLTRLNDVAILPVLDIPRFYHQKLGFSEDDATNWCYQLFNFFGNRKIPLVLHLVDVASPEQHRQQFTALGQGSLPYEQLLLFIRKTKPLIKSIVLEFEDKINAIESREYLAAQFDAV